MEANLASHNNQYDSHLECLHHMQVQLTQIQQLSITLTLHFEFMLPIIIYLFHGILQHGTNLICYNFKIWVCRCILDQIDMGLVQGNCRSIWHSSNHCRVFWNNLQIDAEKVTHATAISALP